MAVTDRRKSNEKLFIRRETVAAILRLLAKTACRNIAAGTAAVPANGNGK
jgi:hypothetical protein